MSADLLRRAAAKLREHASTPMLTPGPWVCLDRGDRIVHLDGDDYEYVVDEPVSNSANAELIALMDPIVVLAVAEWLDATAASGPIVCNRAHAVAVARAVLREGGAQ